MTCRRDMASGGGDIGADKHAGNVCAYDRADRLLAPYLATMGGKEKPASTSVFKVKGVDGNPLYADYHN